MIVVAMQLHVDLRRRTGLLAKEQKKVRISIKINVEILFDGFACDKE